MFKICSNNDSEALIAVDINWIKNLLKSSGEFPEFAVNHEFKECLRPLYLYRNSNFRQSSAYASLKASIGEFIKNALDEDATLFCVNLKFSKATCEDEDPKIIVEIFNNGNRIRDELCGKFTATKQLLSPKKYDLSRLGGAGLGLNISAKIVESTQGELRLTNLSVPKMDCLVSISLCSSTEPSKLEENTVKKYYEVMLDHGSYVAERYLSLYLQNGNESAESYLESLSGSVSKVLGFSRALTSTKSVIVKQAAELLTLTLPQRVKRTH